MKKQREIKFRYVFKDKNGKLSMEEWSIEEIEEMELEDNHTIKNPFLDIVARLEFTGLKDKNGKMIFEGDLARLVACGGNPEYIGKIVFHKGKFQAEHLLKNREKIKIVERSDIYNKWEIIGNIYEKGKELQDDRGDDSGKYESDYCKDCV